MTVRQFVQLAVAPPGFVTVTVRVVAVAVVVTLYETVSEVELLKVTLLTVRAALLNATVAPLRKPVPVMPMLRLTAPWPTVFGAMELTTSGAVTVWATVLAAVLAAKLPVGT